MSVCPAMLQYHTEQSEHVRAQPVNSPLMTVDAANRYGLAAASMVKYYSNTQHGQKMEEPLHTVTVKDREALTVASLSKFFGGVVGTEVSTAAYCNGSRSQCAPDRPHGQNEGRRLWQACADSAPNHYRRRRPPRSGSDSAGKGRVGERSA